MASVQATPAYPIWPTRCNQAVCACTHHALSLHALLDLLI